MDEKKIDKLCDLLERIEMEGDADTAAALREAIFKIESIK